MYSWESPIEPGHPPSPSPATHPRYLVEMDAVGHDVHTANGHPCPLFYIHAIKAARSSASRSRRWYNGRSWSFAESVSESERGWRGAVHDAMRPTLVWRATASEYGMAMAMDNPSPRAGGGLSKWPSEVESIGDGFYDGLLNWNYGDKARHGLLLDQYWPVYSDWLRADDDALVCWCGGRLGGNCVRINKRTVLNTGAG